jgi:uncharacterized membrane protein YphA (DoxX/SURF4 family)
MRLPGSVLQGILARAALVFLRVYLGMVFVAGALGKLRESSALTLGGAVGWGELIVGVALLLGFLTRFAAGVVLVVSVNALVLGEGNGWNPGSSHAALAAIALALLVGAAGRTAGIDAVLARRWPRSPFW